jgi:hypothetical protein
MNAMILDSTLMPVLFVVTLAKSSHVVTTKAPPLFLTPVRERLALVPPPFGQKSGDEKDLPAGACQLITADEFAVGAFQFERLHLSHGGLGLEP